MTPNRRVTWQATSDGGNCWPHSARRRRGRSRRARSRTTLVSGRVIPLRQQHNAVWVESLLLQRIDGTDHLTLDQINNGDRAVAHARQIEQRVLHEGELLVLGDGDVMGTFRCGNRLE